MKKRLAIHLSITIIALLTISITACKKKTENTPSVGTIYLHMHSNIDTSEVEDSTELYADALGRHIGLSNARFYISNITLHNVNGSTYTIPGAVVLKTLDEEQYLVGTAPIGTYDYFSFTVGLDAATNALTPASFTNTSNVSNSPMWFGTTDKGYMFMQMQGMADTTAAQTGLELVSFSYEIGSAANLKTITMPVRSSSSAAAGFAPYVLTAGGTQYLHLVADFGKLLESVNFKTEYSTDTYTANPSLATKIADNIPKMFEYEE